VADLTVANQRLQGAAARSAALEAEHARATADASALQRRVAELEAAGKKQVPRARSSRLPRRALRSD